VTPIIEIDEANFETEVLKSSQPVLVEFATGWSLPSMTLDGAMDEIATEFVDSLKVARVKLDHSPNLGCGTAFGASQRSCISTTARCASEFLGPRTRKQFFRS
jgi:thioredoxin 1